MTARPRTFAGWCRTEQPKRLGLEPGYVKQICERMQSGPEMHAIRSWSALQRHLKTRRSWLYFDTHEWERFLLIAQSMWYAFKDSAR